MRTAEEESKPAAKATADMLPREVLHAKPVPSEADKYSKLKKVVHKNETITSQEASDYKKKIDNYAPPKEQP